MGKKICKYFAQTGFCKFRNCRYEHVGQKHAPVFDKSRGQPGGSNEEHNSEAASFGRWRAKLSGGPVGHYGRASGVQLGPFFKEARRLMTTDEGTRQNVIHCLASEDGLKLIQKLIQREFSSISETEKTRIFHVEIQSFLEIISSPEIHESLILEQDVGTIYNCIYGVGGRRAHPFLEFLADAVAIEKEGDTKAASVHLEMSLFVFSQVIELNSVAFVQDNLKVLAQRFTDIITALYAVDSLSPIQQSLQYLKRLQRRLDHLSCGRTPPGGRHDNDFADISKINIMPTFDEINSPRAEYLPVKDPRQWHVNGIAGLLDRNFRLLREDTIGQLRDSIHAELHPSSSRDIRKNQTRTYVYRHINVQSIDLHRSSGMQFLVSFAQLVSLKGSDKKRREEWWNLSKRLQPSALVCLVDPRGFALFCTVATPDRRHEKEDANDKQWKMSASLSQSAHYASVILELVEPSETNWQYILNCRTGNTARNNSQISLLEFPGILLPSFHPTLRALQKMQKLANVSMSEFLAPLEVDSLSLLVDVPPPAYATSPGFSFDLKCLMNDKSSLKVASSEPVDMEKLRGNSTLDEAQARALVTTLQRCIGLIQGPPGTGKSFTGVALIKVLLENKSQIASGLGPIICVCYTNHALDQLLEDLLDSNITSQVIRIGSQSKSERLEKHQLRKVRVEKTRLERTGQWELHNVLDGLEERFRKIHLNSVGSGISVKHYLRTFHPDRYSQFFDKDHDGYERASASKDDPEKTMKSWLKGGKDINSQTRGLEELRHIHIDQMTATERRNLHRYWVDDQKERTQLEAQAIFTSHLEAKASWDKIRDELDLRCLRDADVIGITTSGLARNLDMLRRLKSKVLVCEEAGEVLEAHLLTSLLPSIQHVILIGDHQQLRPQIQNYGLSRESHEGSQYALDRSLFERLVEPDDEVGIQIPFCTLETQRRMFPSISRLIRDTLYPSLEDAPSVSEYPEVMGIKKRLFWLDHRYTEGDTLNQDPMATSHWNDHEIQMTVALVNHLLRQGVYESGDIAVLTPYLGQLHRIRRKLAESYTVTLGEGDQEDLGNAGFTEEDGEKKEKGVSRSTLLQTVRAATIDNFQGEEAKVVVISLVRSNSQRRCGFLRTPNRANVLLSRAKHGMYIIGNSETSRGVDMWGKVLHILEKDGNLGTQLELTCPRHPDTPIVVEEPDHFVYHSPEGGVLILPVLIHVMPTAMAKNHALHAPYLVKCNVPIPDARKNAPSLVLLALLVNVSPLVPTVAALCPAPPRAITFHVLYAVASSWYVAINALRIDGQMDLRKHYKMDDQSRPISIAASSEPFSMGDIRACATCRGSLRNISRYGRLVRRALLDEATKKLIVYLNQRYVPLAQELPEALSKLQEQYSDTVAQLLFHGHSRIELKGSPSQQVALMRGLLNKRHKSRWHQVLSLREKIVAYQKQVEVDEQPYNRVRNMVEDARRRKKTSDQFRFDETVLQTKGQIQATSLLLRIDIALLGDFVSMKNHLRPGIDQCELYVDFEEHRKVCRRLFNDAKASRRILHQAESSIFLAQLYALEITNIKDISLAESLRGEANLAIDMAVTLCQEHPDQTPGLSDEIEGTRAMLRGAKFYAPVSNEERLAVLKAMAREFRGTGHWYYCENGHPFTIGECGMAMQLSRCPECGAPVGGQNHQSAHGVVHARDLEEAFRELQI
ncbi:hypothetical protein N7468_005647 [Penicillium chermesinum]|uniref:NFX1-type zinc finger-containing protein 1 n=1 Tax=Penicillium chermesinum TaxID=63820 RepID=A0A9W9NZY0_9EURO|nr:uncharacterized protein N7468_005647 [Penicillium chermesinum]KAJ5232691.1 hypothetical protein N7468_005647 [Penicillium chermesinum]